MRCSGPSSTCKIPLVLRISLHVRLCSPAEIQRCFGGSCCFHLQGWKVRQARSQRAVLAASLYMRGFIFSLCSSFRVTDQVPHSHEAVCILYFGNYKTRNNRCNVGSIKQEVTKIASFGFKPYRRFRYNGTWQTLFGAGGQDRTVDKGSASSLQPHVTSHKTARIFNCRGQWSSNAKWKLMSDE